MLRAAIGGNSESFALMDDLLSRTSRGALISRVGIGGNSESLASIGDLSSHASKGALKSRSAMGGNSKLLALIGSLSSRASRGASMSRAAIGGNLLSVALIGDLLSRASRGALMLRIGMGSNSESLTSIGDLSSRASRGALISKSAMGGNLKLLDLIGNLSSRASRGAFMSSVSTGGQLWSLLAVSLGSCTDVMICWPSIKRRGASNWLCTQMTTPMSRKADASFAAASTNVSSAELTETAPSLVTKSFWKSIKRRAFLVGRLGNLAGSKPMKGAREAISTPELEPDWELMCDVTRFRESALINLPRDISRGG